MRNFAAGLLMFSLVNILYKPTFTIAMMFMIIILFIDIRRNGLSHCLKQFKIEQQLVKSIMMFFICMFIANLLAINSFGMLTTYHYFYRTLPFWMFIYLGKEHNIKRGIEYGLIFSIIWLCIFGVEEHYYNKDIRISGFFYGAPNAYAIMLEQLLPFGIGFALAACSNKIKILFAFLSLMMWYCLYYTQSRGAIGGTMIAVVIISGIYMWKSFREKICLKKIIALVGLLVIILGCGINSRLNARVNYDDERLLLIQSTYNMWSDNKMIGVGSGNWVKSYREKYISPKAKEPDLDMAHNVPLQVLAETGIIGGVGFFIMNFGIGYFLIKKIFSYQDNIIVLFMLWTFLVFNIHSLVDYGLFFKYGFRLFWGLLGIAYISQNNFIKHVE